MIIPLQAAQGLYSLGPETVAAMGADANALNSQLLLQGMQGNPAAAQQQAWPLFQQLCGLFKFNACVNFDPAMMMQVAEGSVWTDEYGNLHPVAKFGLSPYSSSSSTPHAPLEAYAGIHTILLHGDRRFESGVSLIPTPCRDG